MLSDAWMRDAEGAESDTRSAGDAGMGDIGGEMQMVREAARHPGLRRVRTAHCGSRTAGALPDGELEIGLASALGTPELGHTHCFHERSRRSACPEASGRWLAGAATLPLPSEERVKA